MEGQKCSGGCSPLLCRGVSRGPQVRLPLPGPCCVWFPSSASRPASEGMEAEWGCWDLGWDDSPSA